MAQKRQILDHVAQFDRGKCTLVLCITAIDRQVIIYSSYLLKLIMKSFILNFINIDVSNVKTIIHGVASEIFIIRDNIRKLITLSDNTNALSTIFNEIQEMQHFFVDMTDNVQTIRGELPEIASKIAAIHDDMLPQIHRGIQKLMVTMIK